MPSLPSVIRLFSLPVNYFHNPFSVSYMLTSFQSSRGGAQVSKRNRNPSILVFKQVVSHPISSHFFKQIALPRERTHLEIGAGSQADKDHCSSKIADRNVSQTTVTAARVTHKAISQAGRVKVGWVMARHPREMEKVIEMKITLGTWKECSITTDGEENPVSNQTEQIEM